MGNTSNTYEIPSAAKRNKALPEIYQEIDDAYKAGKVTEELKQLINNINTKSNDFLQKNQLSNSDLEQFRYNIATRTLDIINGGLGINPAMIRDVQRDVFNNFSKNEVSAMGNEVVRQAYMSLKLPTASSNNTSTSSTSNPSTYNHFRFKWDDGLQMENWGDLNPTLKSRMLDLNNHFLSVYSDLNQALGRGDIIHGTNLTAELSLDLVNKLKAVQADITNNTSKDLSVQFKALSDIARKAGMTAAQARTFFGNTLPGSEEESEDFVLPDDFKDFKRVDLDKSNLSDYTKNWIAQNNAYLYANKDNSAYKLIGQDGSLLKAQDYLEANQLSNGYDTFIHLDDKGNFYTALGNDLDIDTSSPYFNTYVALKLQTAEQANNNYWTYSYDPMTMMDVDSHQIVDAVYDKLQGDNPSLSNMEYADVSNYFGGNVPVIAVSKNGTAKLKTDKYGNINFNQDLIFYTIDDEGELNSFKLNLGKLEHIQGNNPQRLFGQYAFRPTGTSGASRYLQALRSLYDIPALLEENTFTGNADIDGDHSPIDNDIEGKPVAFIKAMINAINSNSKASTPFMNDGRNNENQDKVLRYWGFYENPKLFTNRFLDFLQTYKNELSAVDIKNLKKAIMNLDKIIKSSESQNISSEKHGGILKAAKGEVLDIAGNKRKTLAEKDIEHDAIMSKRASNAGYDSVNQYEANQEGFDVSDATRLAALGLDMLAAGASFAPTVGTAVSGISSLGALALDAGADIADIVEEGQTWGGFFKNLGANLGFAALGLIPGGKIPKVVQKIIKYAPSIMLTLNTVGAAPELINVMKKVQDPKASLTTQDWKNLMAVGKLLAGGIRGTGNAKLKYQIKNKLKADNAIKKVEGIKGITNSKGEPVVIPQETKQKVSDLLAKNTEESLTEAKTLLKTVDGINDTNVSKIINMHDGFLNPRRLKKSWHVPSLAKESTTTTIDEQGLNKIWNNSQFTKKNLWRVLGGTLGLTNERAALLKLYSTKNYTSPYWINYPTGLKKAFQTNLTASPKLTNTSNPLVSTKNPLLQDYYTVKNPNNPDADAVGTLYYL